MNQHFCVAFDSLVELVVGHLGLINANLVRDNKARLRFTADDQISEVSIVLLNVALTGSQRKTLHTNTLAHALKR